MTHGARDPVVPDTSCLIALTGIGRIDLLSNRSLDLGSVKATLTNLALEYGSGNFAFLFSGARITAVI